MVRKRAGWILGGAGFAALLLGTRALRRRWVPFAIAGASMQPSLEAGDFVLVDRGRAVRRGDIVVARRPDQPSLEVVKRVAAIDDAGALSLMGDNAERSTDSRSFGGVPRANVVGVVRLRYWPFWRLHRFG